MHLHPLSRARACGEFFLPSSLGSFGRKIFATPGGVVGARFAILFLFLADLFLIFRKMFLLE
jgi:hypothetical protein